jgi:hypothetical protein
MERLVVLLAGLAILSVGFGLLERRFAAVGGQKQFRRQGYFTDVAWWLFTPTLGKLFTGIVVAVSIIGLGAVLGLGITGDHLRGIAERDTLIGRQPLLLQIGAFLVLAGSWSWPTSWRTGATARTTRSGACGSCTPSITPRRRSTGFRACASILSTTP